MIFKTVIEKRSRKKTEVCPNCKGKIGISLPIFGGTTKCFELETPSSIKPVETIAPFEVDYINVKA